MSKEKKVNKKKKTFAFCMPLSMGDIYYMLKIVNAKIHSVFKNDRILFYTMEQYFDFIKSFEISKKIELVPFDPSTLSNKNIIGSQIVGEIEAFFWPSSISQGYYTNYHMNGYGTNLWRLYGYYCGLNDSQIDKYMMDTPLKLVNETNTLREFNNYDVVFHWGNKDTLRFYDLDKQLETMKTLNEEGYKIAIVGSTNDNVYYNKKVYDYFQDLPLIELYSLLKYTKVFFGIDSFPLHFACGQFQKEDSLKIISLWSTSLKRTSGPLTNKDELIVVATSNCLGRCQNLFCPATPCVNNVEPNVIIDIVKRGVNS